MNKKGFTLIELLAVIVILAIIALIATPIILKVIENAKKSASIDSAYGYIDAIEFNNAMNLVDNTKYTTKITSDSTLNQINSIIKLKGEKASEVYNLTIEKSRVVSASFCIGGYRINYDGKKATASVKCSSPEPEVINANDVSYTDPSGKATTVEAALNDLYEKMS